MKTSRYEVYVFMLCVLRTDSLYKVRRTINKYLAEGTSCHFVDTHRRHVDTYHPYD